MTRPPSYELEAEQIVLGAAMLDSSNIAKLQDKLRPTDFYKPAHGDIWRSLCAQNSAGAPTEPIAIASFLDDIGQLHGVGGVPYLHDCVAKVPTSANAPYYADIVLRHASNRNVVVLGTRLTQAADTGKDPADILAENRAWFDEIHGRPEAWPDPIPFGTAIHKLPVFPTSALPRWLADMTGAVATETQTPPDLASCIALAALSTAAGGRATIRIRGSWTEPCNIFTVVALPPGSRKSAVFSQITGPLYEAEKILIADSQVAITEADLQLQIATAAAHRAMEAALKGAEVGTNPAGQAAEMAEAVAASQHADAIHVPPTPKLIVDDITSEKVASLLAEHSGRIAVLSAEGGIFATLAGRYSKAPNFEVFLKGHAGDQLRVDRQGRPSEVVEHPVLTLGLALQPSVLRDIATVPGFADRGLLDRILYSIPENTLGRRKIGPPPVSPLIADIYRTQMLALVDSLAKLPEAIELTLTPEANRFVLGLEEQVEPTLAPDGPKAHMTGWTSKFVGSVVRLAGLLHLAEHREASWAQPISFDTLNAAATIGDYYAAHAAAAFNYMHTDPDVGNAQSVLAWLERKRPEVIKASEMFRRLASARFKKMDDLNPAIKLLEQHGYLRRVPAAPRDGKGGRPQSPTFRVHPNLLEPAPEAKVIDLPRIAS